MEYVIREGTAGMPPKIVLKSDKLKERKYYKRQRPETIPFVMNMQGVLYAMTKTFNTSVTLYFLVTEENRPIVLSNPAVEGISKCFSIMNLRSDELLPLFREITEMFSPDGIISVELFENCAWGHSATKFDAVMTVTLKY